MKPRGCDVRLHMRVRSLCGVLRAARQVHAHALLWCSVADSGFCDRGDCEVTLFCSALCHTRAAPDLHSNTSGWPVGEVVVQQETAVAAHAHRRGLGALCVSCCTMTLEAPRNHVGVTCGCTCACAACAAFFVLRVRYTRTLSCGAVWLTLVFVTGETVRSHCFAPRFVTRGRLLTYTVTPRVGRSERWWCSKKPRWLRTHTDVV